MKKIEDLIKYIYSLDIKLWVENNSLCYSAPKGELTEEIKFELIEHKDKIISFLNKSTTIQYSQAPIKWVTREQYMPLSLQQEQIWFLEQLNGINSTYNEITVLNLKGVLYVDVLEKSLNEIIKRHEVLRSNYFIKEGIPVQSIASELIIKLPIIDLEQYSKDDKTKLVQEIANEETQRSFNLSSDSLVRFSLIRLSNKEYVLILVFHHIIFDGWSRGVFFKELSSIYNSICTSGSSNLENLKVQYIDYCCWQRGILIGQELTSQSEYWKKQLVGAPPLLEIQTDRERPPIQTFRGKTLSFNIDVKLTKKINDLCLLTSTTMYMTLLTAFNILLWRNSNQDDIVIGSPFANRNKKDLEPLIGYFVNTLPLRVDLSGNPTFRELLGRVRRVVMNAYAYQSFPFKKIVDELKPERSLGYSPIFQTMFVLQNTPFTMLDLFNLEASNFRIDNRTAKLDLTLTITETDKGLIEDWEYNIDLFDSGSIESLAKQFEIILRWIINNPEKRISEVSLLTEEDKNKVLIEWNNTKLLYPEYKKVHELFIDQVNKTPDSIAVVFEDQQLTYEELNQKSDLLATYLQKQGVRTNTLVGICLERSLNMIIGLLGILKAGGVYIPLDPDYPNDRLEYIIQDSQVKLILSQSNLSDKLSLLARNDVSLMMIEEILDYKKFEPVIKGEIKQIVTGEDLAYIIYTSGSTGKPKGVMISHKALTNFLYSMGIKPGFDSKDKILAITTYCFDIAGLELYLPLINGGQCYICNGSKIKDAELLKQEIKLVKPTVMQATPATWTMLFYSGWANEEKLKILCGGEALSEKLKENLIKTNSEVWNMYGPTETTIWSTIKQIKEGDHITVGKPIGNTQIYIVDKDLNPTPIGVKGELCIAGDGVASGYLNKPELTRGKFIDNPFNPGTKLYKTGDLAHYLSDGDIVLKGRIDNQIKIRGFRIELGEIENTLLSHPAVKEAVVIAKNDNLDNKRLVSYLVINEDVDILVDEINKYVEKWLPNYMIPTAFIKMEKFPLNPNGKIDKNALLKLDDLAKPKNLAVKPITETQLKLVEIIESILGIKGIGITDNFFEKGSNSLLIIRFIAEVESTFGVTLTIEDFINLPSIAEIAGRIDNMLPTANEQDEEIESQLNFWKKYLDGTFENLQIPTDLPRSLVKDYSIEILHSEINSILKQKLEKLGKQTYTTLPMFLLAVFAILLSYISSREDIVIASPSTYTSQLLLDKFLPIRINLSGNPTFIELLNRVRQVVLDAKAHQDIPFEMILNDLGLKGYTSSFQFVFIFDNLLEHQHDFNNKNLTVYLKENKINIDFILRISETKSRLVMDWYYNEGLFKNNTMRQISEQFSNILDIVTLNSKIDLFELYPEVNERVI